MRGKVNLSKARDFDVLALEFEPGELTITKIDFSKMQVQVSFKDDSGNDVVANLRNRAVDDLACYGLLKEGAIKKKMRMRAYRNPHYAEPFVRDLWVVGDKPNDLDLEIVGSNLAARLSASSDALDLENKESKGFPMRFRRKREVIPTEDFRRGYNVRTPGGNKSFRTNEIGELMTGCVTLDDLKVCEGVVIRRSKNGPVGERILRVLRIESTESKKTRRVREEAKDIIDVPIGAHWFGSNDVGKETSQLLAEFLGGKKVKFDILASPVSPYDEIGFFNNFVDALKYNTSDDAERIKPLLKAEFKKRLLSNARTIKRKDIVVRTITSMLNDSSIYEFNGRKGQLPVGTRRYLKRYLAESITGERTLEDLIGDDG